jgi:hypothetical protein
MKAERFRILDIYNFNTSNTRKWIQNSELFNTSNTRKWIQNSELFWLHYTTHIIIQGNDLEDVKDMT